MENAGLFTFKDALKDGLISGFCLLDEYFWELYTILAKDGMKIGPAKGHEIIRDLVTEFPDKFSFEVGQDKYDK